MKDIDIIHIKIPKGLTCGDIMKAQGSIINASANFIAWEDICSGEPDKISTAISPAGKLLIAIAHQLNFHKKRK